MFANKPKPINRQIQTKISKDNIMFRKNIPNKKIRL